METEGSEERRPDAPPVGASGIKILFTIFPMSTSRALQGNSSL